MAIYILKHLKTFFFVLCPSDSFCGKFDINCFSSICENSHWKIKNAVTSTVRKLNQQTFFFFFFFSDVKRRISLVLKVTAKMYLICFQMKDKAEDSWHHSFLGGHVAIIWTSSDCHATLLLSRETDSYKPYGFFLDPFTHYHFVCYLHIYICSIYIVYLFFKWQGGAAFELE